MGIHVRAQNFGKDIDLIRENNKELTRAIEAHHHRVSFLLSDHPSAVIRYNPVSLAFGSLMWVYQKVISPQFSSTCLYSPSCSAYSKDLIREYGIIKGIIFTADRLTRCNRLALIDFKTWEVDARSGKLNEKTSYYRLND